MMRRRFLVACSVLAAVLTVCVANEPVAADTPPPGASKEAKIHAIHQLDKRNDRAAVPQLCAALQDADPEVRAEASGRLIFLHDARALEPLKAALGDDNALVRRHAVYALERLGDRSAVEALIPVLGDPVMEVRYDAAIALGVLADPRAKDALVTALDDESPVVANEAIKALGAIGDKTALPRIIQIMEGEAWRSLGAWPRAEVLGAFSRTFKDPRAIPLLRKLTTDVSPTSELSTVVALNAAAILAEAYDDPYGTEVLRSFLKRDDYSMQDACESLAHLKDSKAVPGMAEIVLTSRWTAPRRIALDALIDIGGAEADEQLQRLLKHEDPYIRETAARALGRDIPVAAAATAAANPASFRAPAKVRTVAVDLTPVGNAALAGAILPERRGWRGQIVPAQSLAGIRSGATSLRGIPFTLPEKAIVLSGNADLKLPAKATIAVRDKGATLYLLHATAEIPYGQEAGAYTVTYQDNSTIAIPVTVGRDVQDWATLKDTAAGCAVAWRGCSQESGQQNGLYVLEWSNPHPDKEITSIAVSSTNARGVMLVAGVTLSNQGPRLRAQDVRGLTDQIVLTRPVVYYRDGTTELKATLVDTAAAPVTGATVTADMDGKQIPLIEGARGEYAATLSAPTEAEHMVSRATVSANREGYAFADVTALVYNRGLPRLYDAPYAGDVPQFIILGVDDIRNVEGTQRIEQLVSNLAEQGVRVPFSLYVTSHLDRPTDREGLERSRMLWQRLYNMGSEICNHTMNHNLGGIYWSRRETKEEIEREVEGHRDWLRENVHGLWSLYSFKGGGGARSSKAVHPEYANEVYERQNFEYGGRRGDHPDIQSWPYKLGRRWVIECGCLDGNAAPMSEFITWKIHSDYSGQFYAESREASTAMWKANFEHHYNMPNRPPLVVNAFHDWGFKAGRTSHLYEASGLEAFLMDVLVTNRDKYPNTHVVTFHQLIKYMKTNDLPAILAELSGQDKAESQRNYPDF